MNWAEPPTHEPLRGSVKVRSFVSLLLVVGGGAGEQAGVGEQVTCTSVGVGVGCTCP